MPIGAPVRPIRACSCEGGVPACERGAPVRPKGAPLMVIGVPTREIGAPMKLIGAPLCEKGAPGKRESRLCNVSQGWCTVCGKYIDTKKGRRGGRLRRP